jgi:hypothetical protein
VLISTRRSTRVDFEIIRLGEVCGKFLDAPDARAVESVVVRLPPTARYTTPDSDGEFCFHNLRPGEYSMEVDLATLPPLTHLAGLQAVSVHLDSEQTPAPVEYRLVREFEVKPVRRRTIGEVP